MTFGLFGHSFSSLAFSGPARSGQTGCGIFRLCVFSASITRLIIWRTYLSDFHRRSFIYIPVFQPRRRIPKVGTWNDFLGTRARFNDHKYLLDSLEILLFSGTEMLHCLVSSLYSYTHTDLSRHRGKIIANVHGFRVLQQNFNRGDITFLTKKFWGRVKKGWKTRMYIETTCSASLSQRPIDYRHCPYSMRNMVYVAIKRPSVCPSVPSFASRTPLLRVCCWAPGVQEISIDCCSTEPPHCAQQPMRAVPRLQLT